MKVTEQDIDIAFAKEADINKQLADENNPVDPTGLEIMREQAWDQEEQQLGQANHIWRDCMQAVNK